MASKKISQLTSASTPLTGTEELAIVQGGQTLKATAQDVADLAGAPYLVYTANLYQTGTNAPEASSVQENTIGISPIFTYINVGEYQMEFPGLFPIAEGFDKVSLFFTNRISHGNVTISQAFPNTTLFFISSVPYFSFGPFTANQPTDSLLAGSIEIRIYP